MKPMTTYQRLMAAIWAAILITLFAWANHGNHEADVRERAGTPVSRFEQANKILNQKP